MCLYIPNIYVSIILFSGSETCKYASTDALSKYTNPLNTPRSVALTTTADPTSSSPPRLSPPNLHFCFQSPISNL
jgi:hypothetical protein